MSSYQKTYGNPALGVVLVLGSISWMSCPGSAPGNQCLDWCRLLRSRGACRRPASWSEPAAPEALCFAADSLRRLCHPGRIRGGDQAASVCQNLPIRRVRPPPGRPVRAPGRRSTIGTVRPVAASRGWSCRRTPSAVCHLV